MLGENEVESVNSELRYITLELMKIAARRKVSFEAVAKEFLMNAQRLQGMIETSEGGEPLPRFGLPNMPTLPRLPRAPRARKPKSKD